MKMSGCACFEFSEFESSLTQPETRECTIYHYIQTAAEFQVHAILAIDVQAHAERSDFFSVFV